MSESNTTEPILVGADDLPITCPGSNSPTWCLHPREFLDVTKTGKATCPYCGTVYQLKPGEKVHAH